MKITADYTLPKIHTNVLNNRKSQVTTNTVQQPIVANNTEYNPAYYAPISFKGNSGFENYFPTDIFGMNEEKFDSLILNTIEDPAKRNKLAEYITSLAAKDNQTMNFINMWKRQIPTIVSQGMLTTMNTNTSDFLRRITAVGSRNHSNSTLDKFLQSDYQTEIIKKDGKSAAAGLISWKLFNLGNIYPGGFGKGALYLSAVVVGLIGYDERSKDTQEIQNKQFLQAIKEMMKIGVIDPYLLLDKIDKSATNFSPEQQERYLKWQNNRINDLRYQKTGSIVDKHNDFETPEAKNALLVMIKTLKDSVGFTDENVADLLQLYAATYASIGQTQEAEFLTRMASNIYFDTNFTKFMNSQDTLAYLCIKNDKPYEAFKPLLNVSCATDEEDPTGEKRLNAEIMQLDLTQQLIKKYRNIDYLLQEDKKISKTGARREALTKLLNDESYKEYTSDDYVLGENWLSSITTLSKRFGINDNLLKQLLITISKFPLKNLNYELTDEIDDKNIYKVSDGAKVHYKDNEKLEAALIQSNKYIQKRASEIEDQIATGELKGLTAEEKAQLIVGANLLKGNLKYTINNILEKDDAQCTPTDIEILKICLNNLRKNDNFSNFYKYRDSEPQYLELQQKIIDILGEQYGTNSVKACSAVAEFGLMDTSPQRLIYQIIPRLKYAPQEVQSKYLPELYARYGKLKNYDIELTSRIEPLNDKQALDIIVAYVKYFENTQKIDQTKLMEFLNFLDKIYTTAPAETCEAGFGYLHDTQVFDVPLFDSINGYGSETAKRFKKYYNYTTWDTAKMNSDLSQWVQKVPGLYRVNERKYLDMDKKHESVIFQKKHNQKMDNKMISIENNIDNPKLT